MERKYYLYWIHRPCHTDIRTEGYIGITFKPHKRWLSHKSSAKHKNKFIIHHVINKYDDLAFTILCEGSCGYITNLEYILRPTEYIGWNMAVGGDKPISGKKISPEIINRKAHSCTRLTRFDIITILIDYHLHNMNFSELGRKFNISATQITKHVRNETIVHGDIDTIRKRIESISTRKKGLTEYDYDRILTLHENGSSYNEIASKFDLAVKYVCKLCLGEIKETYNFSCYRVSSYSPMTLTYEGKTCTLTEWSKITGISYSTLSSRKLKKWPIEKILSISKNTTLKDKKVIEYMGRKLTCKEWAKILGMNYTTLFHRITKGWCVESAFNTPVGTVCKNKFNRS